MSKDFDPGAAARGSTRGPGGVTALGGAGARTKQPCLPLGPHLNRIHNPESSRRCSPLLTSTSKRPWEAGVAASSQSKPAAASLKWRLVGNAKGHGAPLCLFLSSILRLFRVYSPKKFDLSRGVSGRTYAIGYEPRVYQKRGAIKAKWRMESAADLGPLYAVSRYLHPFLYQRQCR